MGDAYKSVDKDPMDKFGKCPECGAEFSKIVWGWTGLYHDLICENDHMWKYYYPKKRMEVGLDQDMGMCGHGRCEWDRGERDTSTVFCGLYSGSS